MAPTFIEIKPSARNAPETAALMADYLAFAQQRRSRRPLIAVFTGFAILMLGGGLLGTVSRQEAEISAIVLALAVVVLVALNAWGAARLHRRLAALRARLQKADS